MPENGWVWSCEREIPSQQGAGEKIVAEVVDELKRHEWVEHDVFGVHLALEEGLVNAIRHGNGLDASKKVFVNCKISPHRVWIEITDEGSGFDLAEVPDPTKQENLEVPSGRGILLMRSFMSQVKYNETGNSVVMEKERATKT